jgi:hypothetical protein
MSMKDGFSRYNHPLVVEEDRENTIFITPWETCTYASMPFDLKNVGDALQRAMDHAFNELIGKFMEYYKYALTLYSNKREDHIHHLTKVFERCRLYDLSMNP